MAKNGKKLDAWMTSQGYTDRMLAERLGVDPSYVWYIRNGKRNLSDAFRWKFATQFGVQFANRLFDDPIMEKER
mgnify:CR=1 FL=1